MKSKGRHGHDSQRLLPGSDSEEGTEWEGSEDRLEGRGAWDVWRGGRAGGRLTAQLLVFGTGVRETERLW